MHDWIIQFMNQYGYFGIALLIAIENVFPPIPSEIILTFGGFMTTHSTITIWGTILSATLGSVLGALILYSVGRFLAPEKLDRWLSGRVGRMLHFKPGDIKRAVGWFSRKGTIAVFLCRCVPIVRSLISIPAGMAKMKLWKFLLLTLSGTLIWNTVLVYLGAFAGASWETIASYIDTYALVTLFVLILAAAVVFALFYRKRFRNRTKKEK